MATLSQAKTLGGVGSILVFIPFVSIVGYILVIIAVKDISDDLHDSTIFNNLVIAAVTGIVGALAGGFIFVFGAITAAATFTISGFLGLVTGLLVVWIALIISAIFLKRSYDTMGQKLGVNMFKTAATLYLVARPSPSCSSGSSFSSSPRSSKRSLTSRFRTSLRCKQGRVPQARWPPLRPPYRPRQARPSSA